MKIGVLIGLDKDTDIFKEFEKVRDLDMQSCQVSIWDASLHTAGNARMLKEASAKSGVEISAIWAGWSGPAIWDFYGGPLTLGLVPEAFRFSRLKELLSASDFAGSVGVTDIVTHAGFIPENPNDPAYSGVITALRHLTGYMKDRGQWFLFETGQETPVTLVRAIEDIGTGNAGINFDTANLILYGKSNAVDAAGIFGKYVRGLHCKDGEFPTDGKNLGEEKPLGQGRADIARVLEILFCAGYRGSLTIEREITGEEQIRDIVNARDLLRRIVARLGEGNEVLS